MTGGADGAKRSSDGSPLPRDTWVGYAAVAWALAFAAMHLYWAFGGAWLVGEDAVEQSATLLARDPWYYWASWTTLSTAFAVAGLFPLALARRGALPHGRPNSDDR